MKYTLFAFALCFGLAAQAQNCTVTKETDPDTRISYTRTQDEVVVSTAGRRWVYFISADASNQYTLHLKYAQSDQIYTVPEKVALELTTTNGEKIILPIARGAQGLLKQVKGVKSWQVHLLMPLTSEEIEELKGSTVKSMKLPFTVGQATMDVPATKSGSFKHLANCITKQ